ncbi:RCC1-like G exchanging factor-like protein isoform X3 [Cavia porcellus]|uniref:RCC1-like G exchanging factor-like protein isoform X3 n=1 Tax=Cavia porcellus TaxID=10141 RepID=UPI000C87B621|nr:RCC1-like G exchanging factor-like protein isoform X3 [Cavia porcellus]
MALVILGRVGRRLKWSGPGRRHWTPAGRSRSRREAAEAEADAPVVQYVGERAARADRIFVWGFSFSGALGVPTFVLPGAGPEPRAGLRPRRRIQAVPYRLELDQKISSAACGYGFTLLSSRTKDITKVWGMGLNKDSQLGFHRSRKDKVRGYEYVLEPSPVALPLDRPQETRVLQVACGRAHSLILTDGEGGRAAECTGCRTSMAVWSRLPVDRITACSSRTGAKSTLVAGALMGRQVNVPRSLPFSGVGTVKEVACGGTGCAMLNGDGCVFVWGYGILGKGPCLVETAVPEMIPPMLFGLAEFSADVQVSHIRCGLSHFAALTNKGELFVWGKNTRGCLGIGHLKDQYFPWRVTMPGKPVDVACGVDHMVALAKSFI